jgi:hypothetical protein
MSQELKHLRRLVTVLATSLKNRMSGIFVNVEMTDSDTSAVHHPFCDVVYVVSAELDPKFELFWIDTDVQLDHEARERQRYTYSFWFAGFNGLYYKFAGR